MAVLIVGGGVYIYSQNHSTKNIPPQDQNSQQNTEINTSTNDSYNSNALIVNSSSNNLTNEDVYKMFMKDCYIETSSNPSDQELENLALGRPKCQKTVYTFNSSQLLTLKNRLDNKGGGYNWNYDIVKDALSYKLETEIKTNKDTYSEVSKSLSDSSNSSDEYKISTINVLGSTHSKESLSQLLKILYDKNSSEIKIAACNAIVNMASDIPQHEELSPLLEEAYGRVEDAVYKGYISITLAKIGAPSGIKLLIQNAIKNGLNSIEAYDLNEVRNLNAIPILAHGLRGQSINDTELLLSGNTLAEMGQPDATDVIITWARNVGADKASLVKVWLSKVRDEASLKIINDSLNGDLHFKSTDIKNAIKETLDEYNANHSFKAIP